MAYREVDNKVTRYVARLFFRNRWRELFFADWSLKLLALAITLGLWCGVTAQRAPIHMRFREVQLAYQVPGEMVISNHPPDEVAITLKGSREAFDGLVARDLVARLGINHKPGARIIELTPENIQIELPDGTLLRNVQVEKIEPDSVLLQLEPRIAREVPVRPRFEGRLPEGYELGQVRVVPGGVRISGPESAVKAVEQIATESIPLDERTASFTLQSAAIEPPDEKIKMADRFVTVSVEVVASNHSKNKTP